MTLFILFTSAILFLTYYNETVVFYQMQKNRNRTKTSWYFHFISAFSQSSLLTIGMSHWKTRTGRPLIKIVLRQQRYCVLYCFVLGLFVLSGWELTQYLAVMGWKLVQQLFDPVSLPKAVHIRHSVLWQAAEVLVHLYDHADVFPLGTDWQRAEATQDHWKLFSPVV